MSNRSVVYFRCDLCDNLLLPVQTNWHCQVCVVDLCSSCYENTKNKALVLYIDDQNVHSSTTHEMKCTPRSQDTKRPSPDTLVAGESKAIPVLKYPPGVKKPVLYFYASTENKVRAVNVTVSVGKDSDYGLLNAYPHPESLVYANRNYVGLSWDIVLRESTDPTEACSFTHRGRKYPYLYWDTNHIYQRLERGADGVDTVDRSNLESYISRLFHSLGFNERETADFFTYWISAMSTYKCVSFSVTSAQCNVRITPFVPIMRHWIIWSGHHEAGNCIERYRPAHTRPTHQDSTVYAVEWGATEV